MNEGEKGVIYGQSCFVGAGEGVGDRVEVDAAVLVGAVEGFSCVLVLF